MWLTFDWDDVSLDDPIVVSAMQELHQRFPLQVWHRISSSGTGLHIVIAELLWDSTTGSLQTTPREFSEDYTFAVRQEFSQPPWGLECRGRLISDSVRTVNGYRTGRLFGSKNSKLAGGWILYEP
tara:strand:- start:206 stop:580 length:375 start_codon:yes stop_codon:yes gene_type:complete